MQYVAFDSNNGQARLINGVSNEDEAKLVFIHHLICQEIVQDEEEGQCLLAEGEICFYPVKDSQTLSLSMPATYRFVRSCQDAEKVNERAEERYAEDLNLGLRDEG